MSKKMYAIDGAHFKTLEEFYDEISRNIIPGFVWGRNLDAFNDILNGGFGTPEEGFILVWSNSALSRKYLDYSETIRQLEKRLEHCHPTNKPHTREQLEEAKKSAGATVFDWLMEIIHDHDDIELVLE